MEILKNIQLHHELVIALIAKLGERSLRLLLVGSD